MDRSRLVVVAHGEAARSALWEAVEAAKGGDPLAPVTVAVPTTYAGLGLRRELGRRRGLVNVRFVGLSRVAEQLGAPDLAAAGRRPLTPPLRTEAIHASLRADPGPLAPVADHPSTEAALATSFLDLRRAPEAARLRLGERGGRVGTVTRLYTAFRDRTGDFYDEEDLTLAAAAAVERAPERLAGVGHVVVHLPHSLSPGEEELVAALARRGGVTVVLGLTGDPAVDDGETGGLAARLAPVLGAPTRPGPGATTGAGGVVSAEAPLGTGVVSAPDPEDEVRAVVRRVVERAEAGVALHRIAILTRVDEPYRRLVPEVLDGAGITWNGPAPRRLADATSGRVLRGLLDLAEHDLARDAVAAWLASGPIVDPADGRPVDAARWDVLSREAGVVAGADQWAERLAHHVAAVEATLGGHLDADVSDWRRRGIEHEIDTARRLAAFVADLAEQVRPPEPATWPALAAWAIGLVDRYLGGEARRARWPDDELEAGRRVVAALEELRSLETFGAPVDLVRFRRAAAGALDAPAARHGRFGAGVFVGQLRHAYGGSFDVVYVLGAVEGSLPPRGREDPLLPDEDRRAEGLAHHGERRIEERRDYLAALAAAGERILCFPRADPRAQRTRLPARWLLETARVLHGSELTAEQLRTLAGRPWLDVVESFRHGLADDAVPASIAERDLRSLLEWRDAGGTVDTHPLASGALATGALGRGYALIRARATGRMTAFDGLVGPHADLAPSPERIFSPTSLESWARCPFRYLLGNVLRLREIPRPEATETISALEEGSLVHSVLEQFVKRAPARTDPAQPWSEADLALLLEITEDHYRDAEVRGVTGRRVQWLLAQRRIRQAAERFLHADMLNRARLGVAPALDGLELAFGFDDRAPLTVTLDDGRPVRFRGRIDRVDRSPDGASVVVYDYKTGSTRGYDGLATADPVSAGTKLQLPVYALAAAEREQVDDVRAFYWFTRANPEESLVGYHLDHVRERFVETLGAIVDGISAGCFPAYPAGQSWNHRERRETFDNCTYCAFDRLCPGDRLAAWDRKEGDEAIEPFSRLDLEEPEADPVEPVDDGARGTADPGPAR